MTTGRYVALDFETSGYAAHSACAVGLCRIEDGVVTDSFYSLIRPPSSRVLFTHVHGLTWSMLKDAPTFTELWPQFVAFMEGSHAILAHNAGFDRRVLHASCQALGLVQPQLPFLCTRAAACLWHRGRWTAFATTSVSRWIIIMRGPMPGPVRRSICACVALASRMAR